MGSKRLPGKVLLPLNGHTVIGEVLTRCRRILGVNRVVCAVPDTAENDELADYAFYYGSQWQPGCHEVYRGPEHNVLVRYAQVAEATEADIIVRVTGDCPLISPELCGEVVAALKRSGADYASNIEPRTFPQGMDCEAFTFETLQRAWLQGEDEHVTTWMRKSPDVKRVNVRSPWPLEGRLTLDTEDDYRVICAYFGHAPYEHLRAA
jgi:spore coat polysaccharide biosynthesis protein SpsF (cytidylyltransferase family)